MNYKFHWSFGHLSMKEILIYDVYFLFLNDFNDFF